MLGRPHHLMLSLATSSSCQHYCCGDPCPGRPQTTALASQGDPRLLPHSCTRKRGFRPQGDTLTTGDGGALAEALPRGSAHPWGSGSAASRTQPFLPGPLGDALRREPRCRPARDQVLPGAGNDRVTLSGQLLARVCPHTQQPTPSPLFCQVRAGTCGGGTKRWALPLPGSSQWLSLRELGWGGCSLYQIGLFTPWEWSGLARSSQASVGQGWGPSGPGSNADSVLCEAPPMPQGTRCSWGRGCS